ncbi:hypothetical protein SADUNF_Sadunf05G0039900 [Salix dunnii]|uniref:Uncharacterized protein n=1 Tax=Salix dunnii TaxID=1413687 RepID=A0A835K9E9_9ROSI|nr:hypothetical protein SADUNF_Sadunf05G0039900 [Salix dunnii]
MDMRRGQQLGKASILSYLHSHISSTDDLGRTFEPFLVLSLILKLREVGMNILIKKVSFSMLPILEILPDLTLNPNPSFASASRPVPLQESAAHQRYPSKTVHS